jgi:hypothetical protein
MQHNERAVPMEGLVKCIAFILAGGFVVKTAKPALFVNDALQSGILFTIIIGGILILAGILFLITTLLPPKRLKVFNKFYNTLWPVLFCVAVVQVFDLIKDLPIIFLIIFPVLLLAVILFLSWRLFLHVESLLYMSITLTGASTILLWLGSDELLFIKASLSLAAILFLMAIGIMSRQKVNRRVRNREGKK